MQKWLNTKKGINFVILDRTAGCGPACPVVWEEGGYPVPLSQFTPRIDAIPDWLFFQCIVKVIARRSQSQVQDKPRKEDHFYVITKR